MVSDLFGNIALRGLNHLLQRESWARQRLHSHAGAQFLIAGGVFNLRLGVDEQGYFCTVANPRQPDVTLSLPSDAAARFLLDRASLFAGVKIEGTADVAESLAFVFRNLQWDVEADLAPVIGDIAARRLTRFGRALAQGLQNSVQRTAENLAEYVIEESALLASDKELSSFSKEVSALEADVGRLEGRLSRL